MIRQELIKSSQLRSSLSNGHPCTLGRPWDWQKPHGRLYSSKGNKMRLFLGWLLCSRKMKWWTFVIASWQSIRDGVLHSGMLLYLHHINFKIFFHPTKFENFCFGGQKIKKRIFWLFNLMIFYSIFLYYLLQFHPGLAAFIWEIKNE